MKDKTLKYMQALYSGVLVEVIERVGHREVVIHLCGDVTRKDVEKALPFAIDLNAQLIGKQGLIPNLVDLVFIYIDLRIGKAGYTYKKAAAEVNGLIAMQLKTYVTWWQAPRMTRGKFVGSEAYNALVSATTLLYGFLKREEVNSIINQAKTRIREGKPPFENDNTHRDALGLIPRGQSRSEMGSPPVTQEIVKEKLWYWKRSRKKQVTKLVKRLASQTLSGQNRSHPTARYRRVGGGKRGRVFPPSTTKKT